MQQRSWFGTLAAASAVAVTMVACSDQGVTDVASVASPRRPSFALVASGDKVCSASDGANMIPTSPHPSWAAPVPGSVWVGKSTTSSTNRTRLAIDPYTTSFTVPAGSTNIKIVGNVLVDNDVVINGGGADFFTTVPGPYPIGAPDVSTLPNFQTVGGLPFARNSGFVAGAANTVTFTAYNDDDANAIGNPAGLSFCYTVTFDPAPPPVAVFVIGDVEPHAVGDNVNFWGAQWWKNNFMSGTVSNGVASFKGYAVNGGNVCGGTWTSLPGNSSNPPDAIGSDILIIVTSKVLKAGPNISGDIKQLVTVHQDGGYGPNPGHAGNGVVTSVSCP